MKRRTLLKLLLLLFPFSVLPSSVHGWGGRVHMDINRAAALNVPDDMAAWRDYAKLLSRYSIQPDLWKGTDEAEGSLHYLDAERFQPIAITNLPEDHARLFELTGRDAAADGLLPWVIMDVQNKLTQAMASNDWELAARCAAALGHYVADAHQPLHTTEHYDGSRTEDGSGLHLRWEEKMPFFFWKTELISPAPAQYIKDPWSAVLQWLDQSHARFRPIYTADQKASDESDEGVGSADYYGRLWKDSRGVFVDQVNAAVSDLSSLWYTAWIRAGRPPIPKPPVKISDASIWTKQSVAVTIPVIPLLLVLAGVGVIVLIISMARRRT